MRLTILIGLSMLTLATAQDASKPAVHPMKAKAVLLAPNDSNGWQRQPPPACPLLYK
ncbi:MAG: hypothetical protein M3Z32_00895 [Acidobacteriota bacterium]|nr:hypothetical protein [Acidobacteriota bacterium]